MIGASFAASLDRYVSVDRATPISRQARRADIPRFLANATCSFRPQAFTISFG
jgi:hypothetical protein